MTLETDPGDGVRGGRPGGADQPADQRLPDRLPGRAVDLGDLVQGDRADPGRCPACRCRRRRVRTTSSRGCRSMCQVNVRSCGSGGRRRPGRSGAGGRGGVRWWCRWSARWWRRWRRCCPRWCGRWPWSAGSGCSARPGCAVTREVLEYRADQRDASGVRRCWPPAASRSSRPPPARSSRAAVPGGRPACAGARGGRCAVSPRAGVGGVHDDGGGRARQRATRRSRTGSTRARTG